MRVAKTLNEDLIGGREAREILGITAGQLMRLKRRGRLTVRQFPNMRPLYLRSEVERLAAESMRPALASA